MPLESGNRATHKISIGSYWLSQYNFCNSLIKHTDEGIKMDEEAVKTIITVIIMQIPIVIIAIAVLDRFLF